MAENKEGKMKAFMERQKATEVSKEEDDKVLEELKADEEAKATIIDMAETIRKGGGDEDR